MDILRDGFDGLYNLIKPVVFEITAHNPKLAHRFFINSLRGLSVSGLADLVLDNHSNHIKSSCKISNAAGFASFIIVTGFFVVVYLLFLSKYYFGKIILWDVAVIFIPQWFTGMKLFHKSPPMHIKIKVIFDYIYFLTERQKKSEQKEIKIFN